MTDYAASLALFLTEKTGSCLGQWSGNMSAKDQRKLFGQYIGKGKLFIDGSNETIEHYRKVCFGLDSECTKSYCWSQL